VLADLGYRARCALNGQEALAQLADGYDLVVLDIKMPGMDGRAVYERIQQEYPHLARRVLLTTGDVVNTETKAWSDTTGCAVLEKPFTIEQLASAVARMLICNSSDLQDFE
jgi:two-component system NtrC family sensor kinase